LVCQMSPMQVWSWWLVVVRAHLFSQCNMVWRSLPRARGSGCWSFDSPWCLTPAKHGSDVSASSLIHGTHAVCLWAPVTILDSPEIVYLLFWCLIFWVLYIF
jgi:hypothetical protein